MIKLVLIRHGESIWNLENRFTGWTDIDLSENGIKEAHDAGKILKAKGYSFDIAYTSVLKRANHTLDIILEELNSQIPINYSWQLNERHYGALQGLNKKDTALKYSEEQVQIWRRSYATRPPALTDDDERYQEMLNNYSEYIPHTESLKDTFERVVPYFEKEIAPKLKTGKKILIVAHGNSLRSLIKYLDNLTDTEVVKVEIPTATPLVYELDDNLKPIKNYYLK